MARLKDVQKVVERLSKADRKELLRSFDHCLLMVNRFEETGKPGYYVRMRPACEAFLGTLDKLEEKAGK